jgi:UDP-N-acetylglucosamine--N-acetylmuramyl-(pentapeptide) pyrophosphoryl-undecaprenol N-acetylglucosamine transferase
MANSILGKFADRVAVSYPEAEREFPASQVVLTGNPVREDILSGDPEKAREMFGLSPERKTIFVWGGSQGAKVINEKIVDLLPELLRRYQVIHQTGEANLEETKRRAGELGIKAGHEGYYPVAFIRDELKDILAISDLVVSRAGANSISEIAAKGKPAIIIPIEKSANDHQRMNAYSVARMGACIVLEENNLGETIILNRINQVMDDSNMQAKLSENIKNFYHPDATERLADGVLGLVD